MPQLLFVDACVRGAESRSRMLAERFLSSYAAANPDAAILRRDLMRDRLEPQYPEVLACRDALAAAGKLDDPLFADAWQFARADRIVLAAPFWELSFPAILKIYLERVSMRDITFGYEESGLVGRCRAEKLLLVTTRGGDYSLPETEWMEMGARQLKALCAMFGIPKFELLCAEGLDDERVDAQARMDEALARADALGGENRRAIHRQAKPLGLPRLPGGKRERPAQKLIEGQRAVGFGCDVRKEH